MPFSTRGNLDLLKRAGFKDVLTVFKYACFEGFWQLKNYKDHKEKIINYKLYETGIAGYFGKKNFIKDKFTNK